MATETSVGQAMLVQLMTVTVKEQVAVRLEASVAVQVTVVVPTAKFDPEAGTHAVVTPEQLSAAVGAGNVNGIGLPVRLVAVWLDGQVMVGFWLSLTVTVKLHEAILFAASVAVQVTVVTPFWKVEPEAGVHVAVTPAQLSVGKGVA